MLPFPIISNTKSSPVYPKNIKKFVSSSTALLYLTVNGNLYGAGANVMGELGSSGAKPQFILIRSGVRDVFASLSSASVIVMDSDGKVMFSGNSGIYTGSSSPTNAFVNITTMFSSASISLLDIKTIDLYSNSKINVLMNDGRLFCSGKNNISAITSFGDGTNTDSFNAFRFIRNNVLSVNGNYILDDNNNLYGCGTNTYSQLSSSVSSSGSSTFVLLSTGVTIIQAGVRSIFCIKGGLLYIMGSSLGIYGEFGDGSTSAVTYSTLTNIVQAGSGITQLVQNVGNLLTHLHNSSGYMNTGNGVTGQLGRGSAGVVYTFGLVPNITVPSTATIFSCNLNTYIVYEDNSLVACGGVNGGFNVTPSSNVLTFQPITLVTV
ncbi:BNR repeat domain protein [Yersinia phage fHe-Yen9-04]|uniref:BNR repeat domain protein n=1 Tax=Yersinia phage fHe-Yen9-04 TaxID=2052742 RepID=A0A2C9CYD4_9CAUD|nr:regulator of chromosome condensation [Yersinia phage fHe-Yen9-04]SOK58805.1 BNR repeat domain protein [Yersinia phage fHe-Yen9-04]VUE36574.1 BNR repeat domain protein [Yersinia phage fHe-Yen9-04]